MAHAMDLKADMWSRDIARGSLIAHCAQAAVLRLIKPSSRSRASSPGFRLQGLGYQTFPVRTAEG